MLTDADRAVLDFEERHWKYAGAKEAQIREQFGFSATRYYQLLNALIDRPEALAYNPMLVKRLQRVREARRRQRSAASPQDTVPLR
jgi:hypothetical protein